MENGVPVRWGLKGPASRGGPSLGPRDSRHAGRSYGRWLFAALHRALQLSVTTPLQLAEEAFC